ncbi:START domain-containing protein [Vibrio sinaloensis]|uniref:START domain-containing protein n=1 Tax=Photobacterium sp. (strain ATCC 43367) TaxID=379097 RepID=UPI0022AF255C|nr:START domain-containing protein [Vibrio sinaloensis]MCZ4293569.1 START domain-containing protein [Vibrio sinaloensis]
MTSLRKSIILILLMVSSASYSYASTHWQFEGDADGISIFSRHHSDGLVEIRARMFAPTSYAAFLALLEDTENVPNWIDNVSHSRVLRQISPNENIVYTQFSAPWPAKDRDMVTYSKYALDEIGFTLKIEDAPQSILTEQEGYVRISEVQATWTLQKLTNGMTLIEYTAFANPGGALPNWLINKLAKESARSTFEGLKQQLPNYQDDSKPDLSQ